MTMSKRTYWIGSIVAAIALLVAAITMVSVASSAGAPGQIDDGADLLPLATITLEDAIAAAQAAESGALGEVDLEMYEGRIVFNVDIGDKDMKIDAENGTVLGSVSDD